MSQFEVHTIESAPAESRASLQALEQGLGFVPNLAAAMAGSPALVNSFVQMRGTLAAGGLTGAERELVAIAVSRENDCDYCMAAHSTFALMQKADPAAVEAARAGRAPSDAKLGALYEFARALVARRGHVGEQDVQALLDGGCSREAALTAIAQVAHTTMANYVHNLADVTVDEPFRAQAWERAAA
ncbi:MAG TPA: carboxymuconolactone decarboxylase family protein [Solirubrobacteraceae bacterium]|nr:carboxymuconolactone decarboxylase family protein [Solirubrobacteraceae bacterium]